MNDRELLELAARAAGEVTAGWHGNQAYLDGVLSRWNPLTDDGDALRLATDLQMTVEVNYSGTSWHAYARPVGLSRGESVVDKDRYNAVRLAVTRAAAEIGKTMEGEKNGKPK